MKNSVKNTVIQIISNLITVIALGVIIGGVYGIAGLLWYQVFFGAN